ncbi:alpha/beta fold hydrolase [Piscinibacter sp. Jin2]|uniref:Proline iminopeptidase n=1 Tax=Aquariibacter lacus TaxID=2801332 RepID=A0A9X0XIZ9_9BURK|nr:alpha/beta fold hydrolase [Piscinibacter lacus]MBL0720335.1 alpha/beta fold hydrolase [Piscinibacter lacus]
MPTLKLEFLPPDPGHSQGFSLGLAGELALDEGQFMAVQAGPPAAWQAGAEPLPTLLLLHGGPGGQTRPASLTPWDGLPLRWIAADQRGCGRSRPPGERQGQTLDALVADLEALRRALDLSAWGLASGSWGCRLALAYAARHPSRVSGLWLRSPFLGSLAETQRYIAPWRRWLGEAGRAALGPAAVDALEALYAAPADPALAAAAAAGELPASLDEPRLARVWQAFDEAQSAAGGLDARPELRADPALWTDTPADAEAERARMRSWAIHALHGLQAWGGACSGPQAGAGAWVEARALQVLALGPRAIVGGRADACCDPAVVDGLARLWPDAVVDRVEGAGHRMGDERLAPRLQASAQAWARRWLATARP